MLELRGCYVLGWNQFKVSYGSLAYLDLDLHRKKLAKGECVVERTV